MSAHGRRPLAERFWSKVTIAGHGKCWLWNGAKLTGGYGVIGVHRVGVGRMMNVSVHRLSWEFANGPIPEGKLVRHKCDVRACVNPEHLEIGTQLDNIHDMIRRGRVNVSRGESNGQARLTSDLVARMRLEFEDGKSLRALARDFGVGEMSVSDAVHRRTWRHVA